jgi:hypothetical protein
MGSAVPAVKHGFTAPSGWHMDVHPGLARSRTAQRNVPRRVRGELQGKNMLFPAARAVVARSPIARFKLAQQAVAQGGETLA